MTKNDVNAPRDAKSGNQEAPHDASDRANKRRFASWLLFGLAATFVPAILCPPEGAIRLGDSTPVVLLFLLVVALAAFLWRRVAIARPEDENATSENRISKRAAFAARCARVADWALLLFLACALASHLRVLLLRVGDVRYSSNAIWCFAAPAILYFAVRLFRPALSHRAVYALCTLAVACAVAESAYAIYSYAVVNPRLREEYRADPDKMLRESGLALARGSRERELFEKRLLDSSEPTGTYGLANTLAGVLAPALAFGLLGFPWSRAFRSRRDETPKSRAAFLSAGVGWLCALALVATSLVLTKSRAGILAFAVGLTLWFLLVFFNGNRRRFARKATIAIALAFAAVICAFAVGALDREVFTEAGKSLGYRLDYWRATAAMIREHPALGVGPGEFQNAYARFILPTASEFIADPHNFAFEIAALFGVPALVAFLAFIVATFASGLGSVVARQRNAEELSAFRADSAVDRAYEILPWGACVGMLAAYALSFLISSPIDLRFYVAAVPPVVVVLIASRTLFNLFALNGSQPFVPISALLVALAASFVNLCAAGGIGYLSISFEIALFAAFVANESSALAFAPRLNGSSRGARFAAIAPFLLLATATIVFYASAFKPRCNWFSYQNEVQNVNAAQSAIAKELRAGNADAVDGKSIDVAQTCFFFAALDYCDSPTRDAQSRRDAARARVKRVSPNSASARENCGDFEWSLFLRRPSRKEFCESACEWFEEATERSPTDAAKRVKLARALFAAGRREDAIASAKIALQLDDQTPHEDRKLLDDQREEMRAIVDGRP